MMLTNGIVPEDVSSIIVGGWDAIIMILLFVQRIAILVIIRGRWCPF